MVQVKRGGGGATIGRKRFTSAGVRGRFGSVGVSEEAPLAVLTVSALCVVVAAVAHAATPPSARQPRLTTEVTALGVTITLAP